MKKLLIIILPAFSFTVYSQISIDTSFEGANARILSVNNSANTVKIESKLRTGDVHNVVFYCKISGFNTAVPLKIQVKYTQQYYLPVLAAFSYDKITWFRYTGTIAGDSKEFTRYFTQSPVYFCYGYPYTYTDMLDHLNSLTGGPFVTISNLTQSQGGRDVKLVRITAPCVADSSKYSVWILGRNHAMETHSNIALEGLMNFLVSGDVKADRIRRRAIIYIVPVMDADNAFWGGTGKDQLPVDFNRDWDSPSYWPAVIAVKQKMLETTPANPLKIFIDSHNPFPGQNDNNTWFYSKYSSGPKSVNLDFYRKLFQESAGYVINRQPMYATDGQTSSVWTDSVFTNIDFSVSTETSWVRRTDNAEFTIPLYKTHGENLGRGISDYISNIVRPGDIILDNTDTLNGVTITGGWLTSTFVPGYWGVNYIHDNNTGQGSKSVKYSPNIPVPGNYEVFVRWTADTGRANNVPVKIIHSAGVKDTLLNERWRGSEWVSAGIYNFAAGNTGSAAISNTSANGFVIADAVRFAKINYCDPIGIVNNQLPAVFSVSAYPNPFNPEAKIKFSIAKTSLVKLVIYDLLGREVKTLTHGYMQEGEHTVKFNAVDLPSGVYLYKFTAVSPAEINSYSGKLILVK